MVHRPVFVASILLVLTSLIASCGGGGQDRPVELPRAPRVDVEAIQNRLVIRWLIVPGATHYKLLENADGHSGFTQVGADIPPVILGSSVDVSVHIYDYINALYIVQACNQLGCTDSRAIGPGRAMLDSIGYFKAINSEEGDQFGRTLAFSGDGATLAVSTLDDSSAIGIDGDQDDNSAAESGSVYVFQFEGFAWSLAAYIKASNTDSGDRFGESIALSADGTTLAVGALDDSNAIGINGDQSDNSAGDSGAVYVFRFDGTEWSQEAYLKASNAEAGDLFGSAVALSGDGRTLVAGARSEDSDDTGINGDHDSNSANDSGAAYVFGFDGVAWTQEAYIKASNTGAADQFGSSVTLSDDGSVMVAGAINERGVSTGINGDQQDIGSVAVGAAYIFRYSGTEWIQEAYVKPASLPAYGLGDDLAFGGAVDVSSDGNTLVIGAVGESSAATGIDGDPNSGRSDGSGAAYLFRFDGADWTQEAHIKASNTGSGDAFGSAIAVTGDGNAVAIAAPYEDSAGSGVGSGGIDDAAEDSGAVYFFRFNGTDWQQHSFVKASNTDPGDRFGSSVAIDTDGRRLIVGAPGEAGHSTVIFGDRTSNSTPSAGAIYIY